MKEIQRNSPASQNTHFQPSGWRFSEFYQFSVTHSCGKTSSVLLFDVNCVNCFLIVKTWVSGVGEANGVCGLCS